MNNVTDFRKTVESGVDPHLVHDHRLQDYSKMSRVSNAL